MEMVGLEARYTLPLDVAERVVRVERHCRREYHGDHGGALVTCTSRHIAPHRPAPCPWGASTSADTGHNNKRRAAVPWRVSTTCQARGSGAGGRGRQGGGDGPDTEHAVGRGRARYHDGVLRHAGHKRQEQRHDDASSYRQQPRQKARATP